MNEVTDMNRVKKNEERIERRQEEILSAATKMFAENGFPNTDVQKIADFLKIGKGTIYRYFPSKRELFLAAVDRGMHQLTKQIDTQVEDIKEPLCMLSKAIYTYLDFFEQHSEFVELIVQERAEFKDRKKPTYFEYQDANTGKWEELYKSLIKSGIIRDIPTERITGVISNLLYGTIFTNYFVGRQKSFQVQVQDILDILFHGILVPKNQ